MTDIVWERPPQIVPKRFNSSKWIVATTILKAHPGKWARLLTDAPAATTRTVSSRLRHLGCETYFEADDRTNKGQLWARWPK